MIRSRFFAAWYPCMHFMEECQAAGTFVRWSVDMRPLTETPYMVVYREVESQQE